MKPVALHRPVAAPVTTTLVALAAPVVCARMPRPPGLVMLIPLNDTVSIAPGGQSVPLGASAAPPSSSVVDGSGVASTWPFTTLASAATMPQPAGSHVQLNCAVRHSLGALRQIP